MTQVVSLVTNAVQLAVGQSWETNDRKKYWINKIELLPDLNALGGNTRITAIDDCGDVHKSSALDFVLQELRLVTPVDVDVIGGLHGYHLLDLHKSIAVGQRWKHYKGETYVITSVALDANVGADDFNKARISYRSLQTGQNPEWSLTVEEFLRLTESGEKRFTEVPLSGSDKRSVQKDKSLRYMWRISA